MKKIRKVLFLFNIFFFSCCINSYADVDSKFIGPGSTKTAPDYSLKYRSIQRQICRIIMLAILMVIVLILFLLRNRNTNEKISKLNKRLMKIIIFLCIIVEIIFLYISEIILNNIIH